MSKAAKKMWTATTIIGKLDTAKEAQEAILDFNEKMGGKMPKVMRAKTDAMAKKNIEMIATLKAWAIKL